MYPVLEDREQPAEQTTTREGFADDADDDNGDDDADGDYAGDNCGDDDDDDDNDGSGNDDSDAYFPCTNYCGCRKVTERQR